MSHSTDKPVCARANDLVDYLYGEADATEAANFVRHMSGCNECRTEFALMTNVRESMSQWRSEVLGFAWRAEPMAVGAKDSSRKPHLSALAALREFFTISPWWLRGATAVGVALFCLLAALFVTRMSAPQETLYTRAEVQAEVNVQVQRERARLSNENRPAPAAQENGAGNQEVVRETGSPILPASWTPNHPRPGVAKTARHSLSRAEREQLASDLRLKPTADEEDLTFLLEGGSN